MSAAAAPRPATVVSEEPAPAVDAVNVGKSFGPVRVLRGVTLRIAQGSVTCILGASGSGKSTFLRCLNALEAYDCGRLSVLGEPVGLVRSDRGLREPKPRETRFRRMRVGMVFQHFNLFPHMTALGNVMEGPLQALGLSRRAANERAHRYLDMVGLSDRAQHYPGQLSGGQKQRVAIARALAMEPALMLFDEPTSALDPELVGEVLEVMRDLARTGMTMIIVTHQIQFARDVATDVVFMDQGQIVERGTPSQVIDQPQLERTRGFMSAVRES